MYSATRASQIIASDEGPVTGFLDSGRGVFIGSHIANQNHTGEYFDYVTQVYDDNGIVQYINVEYNTPVPLGNAYPFLAYPPMWLNETGLYTVKIFAVIGMQRDDAELASEPKIGTIQVE